MRIIIGILYILLLFFLFTACMTETDEDSSPVIASVGNQELTIENALEQIPAIAIRQDTVEALLNFKDQWVKSQITLEEAKRLKLENNDSYQKRLNRLKNQLSEDMLKEYIVSRNEEELQVSRDEAQNYFQANKDKFVLDERYVRFRHISTSTRTEADNAKRDLMRGISWNEVVDTYSINPELQLRESNQYWPISIAIADAPVLNNYLNVIGLSEISPIHFHNGYYHFVQLLEERNSGDHPDFDWLIPQIQQWLKLEKSQRITNAFIRNLYLQAESNDEISQLSDDETNTVVQDYFSNLESN